MPDSKHWIFRVGGAILGAATLALLAQPILHFAQFVAPTFSGEWLVWAATALGALLGFVFGPRPVTRAQQILAGLSGEQFPSAMIGTLLGLVAAALVSAPLGRLPAPVGAFAPTMAAIALGYLGAVALGARFHDIEAFLARIRPNSYPDTPTPNSRENHHESSILLDTSVIIDGRITDIAKTGFLNARLVVPNFVLSELQHIADSPDPIRRKRGRRGLDILGILRADVPVPVDITDMDVTETRDVDSKLVALARELGCPIMTNDYNLNRVAGLQGVNVLNINDLANAIKAAYLPGEDLAVKIIQEGREVGQGVGYLDDGTMVVVEDGREAMGQSLMVVVTKVLQTSAGRMIFGRITG